MKRVGVITGGSGSSKFATAFSDFSKNSDMDFGFITNVADNYWYHGLYVCPDVDIITHALAGDLDVSKGWGVASDTFTARDILSKLSITGEWFSLGDSDSALCQRRTDLMKMGWSLSSVTAYFNRLLKIVHPIIPATNDFVMTFMGTKAGMMHLQQYWVKHKALPEINQIAYLGLEAAAANKTAISFLSDYVIICPANPVTSILPTILLKKVKGVLRKSKVVAISPFVGGQAYSGPATKMMAAISLEPNSFGVASLYSSFLKIFVVDSAEESNQVARIKDLEIECVRTNTRIDKISRDSMSREILNLL